MGDDHAGEVALAVPDGGGDVEQSEGFARLAGELLGQQHRVVQVSDVGAVPAVGEIAPMRDVRPFQQPEAGGDDTPGRIDQADDGVVRVGFLDALQKARLSANVPEGERMVSREAAIWMSRQRSNMPWSRLAAMCPATSASCVPTSASMRPVA